MQYYSTNKQEKKVNLRDAVLRGLAEDGGLYMPETIPQLPPSFFDHLAESTLQETAEKVASVFFADDLPASDLKAIVHETLAFPIPLKKITGGIYSLELFHGPTMAFKDVGARFMSRLMSYFMQHDQRKLKVVVATSGDTGSAVAAGFYDVEGIDVYVLFPKGKVSPLQQKQITTWGKNIHALEINGTFDDCQALSKKALNDPALKGEFLLTSANSINIARLIPQSFYYFWGAAQLPGVSDPVFCVPSGNFGNLSAGIIAAQMGLKTERFIAATNINDVVPEYFRTQKYAPRPSVQTISNAMDVGDPSNYVRMMEIFNHDHSTFTDALYACAFTDEDTRQIIKKVLKDHDYLLDPHGAIAYSGALEYREKINKDAQIVILETAHPAKFPETLKIHLEISGKLPPQLESVSNKKEKFISLENNYKGLFDVIAD